LYVVFLYNIVLLLLAVPSRAVFSRNDKTSKILWTRGHLSSWLSALLRWCLQRVYCRMCWSVEEVFETVNRRRSHHFRPGIHASQQRPSDAQRYSTIGQAVQQKQA